MPKLKCFVKTAIPVLIFLIHIQFSLAADVTPPVTTLTMDPSSPNGSNEWYVTPINFSLTATDLDSGVEEINYRVDGEAWQKASYTGTLNLVPNPSFENYSAGSSISTQGWEKTTSDPLTSYVRDTSTTPVGFEATSIRVSSTSPGWHGINHAAVYAAATPLANMTASAWIKTTDVISGSYIKIYSVSLDSNNLPIYTFLSQGTALNGTNNWTKVTYNFVVTDLAAVGVYMDIGFDGSGTAWFDAAEVTASLQTRVFNFTVGWDGEHTMEYYSVDRVGNTETFDCNTLKNCIEFKIDQTPPGNWHDSGAFRGLAGADHDLYVYTVVEDATSGLSTLTDKYMYHTDNEPGFGIFSDILACSSTWLPDSWFFLISPPFIPGAKSAYLLTPKTAFCNNDWKTCKTVRFYSEDLAGNSATKDYCINGPWLKFRGEGMVRANEDIDMISEPDEDNTDGLIEAGGDSINYFTSTQTWEVLHSTKPVEYDYDGLLSVVRPSPTTRTTLSTTSGVYRINSDFEVTSTTLPGTFSSASFNQIIFINGNLRISRNITTSNSSTALFVVHGNVEVAKSVNTINVGIMADGDFYTAYDIVEGQAAGTLDITGLFSANKFWFQRTLQGTNNTRYPSESFVYAPKYVTNLRSYLGTNAILWKSVE